jgi:hypothetical protein
MDCTFLETQGIMDYNLLLGVHILKDLSLFNHPISDVPFEKHRRMLALLSLVHTGKSFTVQLSNSNYVVFA